MVAANQNLNGSRNLHDYAPFQGWFVMIGLALAKINLSNKFAVSNSTRYKDTNHDTKYRKWGAFGGS